MEIWLDTKNLIIRSIGAMMTKENFEIVVWDWNLVRLGISLDAFVGCFRVTQVLYDIRVGDRIPWLGLPEHFTGSIQTTAAEFEETPGGGQGVIPN